MDEDERLISAGMTESDIDEISLRPHNFNEYVGQENLNSNVENAGGREAEIERRVALYDRRPEAVDKVAEIVRVLLYALARVFDGEKAYNSADGDERAEENKASGIARGLNTDTESDGDYNRCEHGQESQYRLREIGRAHV